MTEHKSVYLAWQAPETRDWHVVGMLCEREGQYIFSYTKGALNSDKFIHFSGMNDLEKTYVSDDLFPLFKNRVLSSKRPEYPSFLKWLGLDESNSSPIEMLGRSGGLRTTDQLQVFKRINIQPDGTFEHIFFAHGLSHLSESAKNRVSALKPGDDLFLCLDCQNNYDEHAVLIRADNPAEILGYCPRYLAKDIGNILKNDSKSISISVESLSENAPSNYRLMCKLDGRVDINEVDKLMNQDELNLIRPSNFINE